ncbi:hypothetical protein KAT24_02585 [Candidatus Pacearchaeota archaeon]|nr:hypothetical protein [Candidatus Pacearchaeota archaeon]
MALELLKESDKKVLENLAVKFADDFLKSGSGNKGIIGLYGTEIETLDFFKDEMRNYLLGKGEDVQVILGEGTYNVDIGYFFRKQVALEM